MMYISKANTPNSIAKTSNSIAKATSMTFMQLATVVLPHPEEHSTTQTETKTIYTIYKTTKKQLTK